MSTLWIFYALASLLHLPLLSIAFPTELAPRGSTPSLSDVLKKDCHHDILSFEGREGQCKAVQWHPTESILLFENRHQGHLVILIETTIGVVLCFVPPKDLSAMMPKESIEDSKYQELFTDRLLGAEGPSALWTERPANAQLMRGINQLIEWQNEALGCPPLYIVFDFQIATPGTIALVHHYLLVQRMIADLKIALKAEFEQFGIQPDWKAPVYPFKNIDTNNIVLWKSFEDSSHTAKVWIDQAYGANRSPVADIKLKSPVGFPDSERPRWVSFTDGEIEYLVKGRLSKYVRAPKYSKPPKGELARPPKSILQLYEESKQPELRMQNAENTKWMDYDAEATDIQCDHVPLSRGGSLLGFINKGTTPLFMMQTSAAWVLCYIPNSKWNQVFKKWTSYRTSRLPQETREELEREYQHERDNLLQSLQPALEGVDENDSIYGGQFWASYPPGNINFKPLVKDVLIEVTEILQAVGIFSGDPLKVFLPSKSGFTDSSPEETWYSGMWLPPSADEGPVETAWIWKMGRQLGRQGAAGTAVAGRKSPLAEFDWNKPANPYTYLLPETTL